MLYEHLISNVYTLLPKYEKSHSIECLAAFVQSNRMWALLTLMVTYIKRISVYYVFQSKKVLFKEELWGIEILPILSKKITPLTGIAGCNV